MCKNCGLECPNCRVPMDHDEGERDTATCPECGYHLDLEMAELDEYLDGDE